MDLNGLGVKLKAFHFVDEEVMDILALVSLQLDYLTHLTVVNGGAIAGCVKSSS